MWQLRDRVVILVTSEGDPDRFELLNFFEYG